MKINTVKRLIKLLMLGGLVITVATRSDACYTFTSAQCAHNQPADCDHGCVKITQLPTFTQVLGADGDYGYYSYSYTQVNVTEMDFVYGEVYNPCGCTHLITSVGPLNVGSCPQYLSAGPECGENPYE